MTEEIYEDEMDHEALEELPQSPGDGILEKTPWWAISVGLHLVLVLVLSFIIVLGAVHEDAEAVVVSPPRKPRQLPEMDKPKDNQKKVVDIKKDN